MYRKKLFQTLYNEVLQIDISKLKKWGYLEPEQIHSGKLTWSTEGHPTSSISIKANTHTEQLYIELNYIYKGDSRSYRVFLTSTPSNLNRGKIWYFVCPYTKKRCRKLYLINGYFLHREAFRGCLYKIQTHSKKQRQINKVIEPLYNYDDLHNELNKKNFKKTYAGKPTKRYLKIIEQLQQIENTPIEAVNKILFD